MWLETKNLKSPVFQETGTSNQSLSGIAKIIDEADVSADVSQQRNILSTAENKIFKLIENMAFFNGINYSFGEVTTSFTNVEKIPEVPTEKQQRIIEKYNSGFTSKVRAIQELYGLDSLTSAQELYEKIVDELKEEDEKDVQRDNEVQNEEASGIVDDSQQANGEGNN